MSKYRKEFLAVLRPVWARRLPDWKSGLFSPSFYSLADTTFSWIGAFFMGTDSWWQLRDEVAESKLFWESRGLRAVGSSKRKKRDWYASSYEMPQKQIMQEAAEDFTEKFATSAVPKLLSL